MLSVLGAVFLYTSGFIGILSIVGLVLYLVKFKHMIEATSSIPSPSSWPIIGHAQLFIGSTPHQNIKLFLQLVATYGNTFKIWLGPYLTILLADPDDVEHVVNNMRFNDKSFHYAVLQPWLREGLLISRGKKWHQRRKVITPAFHFQILKQFVDVFEQQSRIFVKNLDMEYSQQREEQGFDLHKWFDLCTLDVMCESAMGVSINAQTNTESEYVKAIKTIATVLHRRMFDVIYNLNFTYQFTKLAREGKKALAVLHGFTENIILKRREELLKAENMDKTLRKSDVVEGTKQKMAFLDILLHSQIDGKPLSNLDIREEVDTFMFEGHDTTSSALIFCTYNLAVYPECQEKCVAEIVEVIGRDKSKPFTYDDLNRLPYIEQCIKESMRIYPPVPVMGRYVPEEYEINGKIIPAGANICISNIVMGRQKELYADPLVFKPERFEHGGLASKMNPYAYIPFAAGPRNCIGQKFAMLELKTILANALRHYEFDLVGDRVEELKVKGELVLQPNETLMFKIKPRSM